MEISSKTLEEYTYLATGNVIMDMEVGS